MLRRISVVMITQLASGRIVTSPSYDQNTGDDAHVLELVGELAVLLVGERLDGRGVHRARLVLLRERDRVLSHHRLAYLKLPNLRRCVRPRRLTPFSPGAARPLFENRPAQTRTESRSALSAMYGRIGTNRGCPELRNCKRRCTKPISSAVSAHLILPA